MGIFNIFKKGSKSNNVSKSSNENETIKIPKKNNQELDWNEFLKCVGFSEKDVKGNVEVLKKILNPFLQELYVMRKKYPVNLSKRIDLFEEWFEKFDYYHIDIRELINKTVSWYEMRYSDSLLERMLTSDSINVSDYLNFDRNKYIHDNFDDDSDVYYLEMSKLFDVGTFLKTLSFDERMIFKKEKGRSENIRVGDSSYWLTPKGFVERFIYRNRKQYSYSDCRYDRSIHITDFLDPDACVNNHDLREFFLYYYKLNYLRQEFLNCVMYQIIENYNTSYGSFRALLFAKEFGLDIDIPMIYGAGRYGNTRQMINMYLKFGGSKDLVCYRNYFEPSYKEGKSLLEKESISEMIKGYSGCYTREEKFLHQKLADLLATRSSRSKEFYQKIVDVLSSQVDWDRVAEDRNIQQQNEEQERVAQKRIERKLNK